ncbi:MAG: CDP-alcohol phosphatidyltransferase family protein [Pseudomonadota bacterium]|nr:CDP-alcohol phosphatidyltransferase family protein [Pseudomonadota bacterium]
MHLKWIPNIISIFRILLILPVLLLIFRSQYQWALFLFLIAALSDALDGYLAKHFGWRTRVGALLDPVADKLLIAGSYIVLAWLNLIPFWLAAIVVSRDLIIAIGVFIYSFIIEPFEGEATKISKINTFLELLFVLVILCSIAYDWSANSVITVIGSAVLVTVFISGIDYIISWIRRIRSHDINI